jgi:PleD family two-component response regulator
MSLWIPGESENRNGKRFLLIAFIYKLFTALYEEVLANQAMDEGAFDYITKPIDRDYLESALMTKLGLIGVGE